MQDESIDPHDTWAFFNLGWPWIVRGFNYQPRIAVLSAQAWAEVGDARAIALFGISPSGFRWLNYG